MFFGAPLLPYTVGALVSVKRYINVCQCESNDTRCNAMPMYSTENDTAWLWNTNKMFMPAIANKMEIWPNFFLFSTHTSTQRVWYDMMRLVIKILHWRVEMNRSMRPPSTHHSEDDVRMAYHGLCGPHSTTPSAYQCDFLFAHLLLFILVVDFILLLSSLILWLCYLVSWFFGWLVGWPVGAYNSFICMLIICRSPLHLIPSRSSFSLLMIYLCLRAFSFSCSKSFFSRQNEHVEKKTMKCSTMAWVHEAPGFLHPIKARTFIRIQHNLQRPL